MFTWEYQVKKWSSQVVPEALVSFLNIEGAKGWEVVSLARDVSWITVYFKKVKNEKV